MRGDAISSPLLGQAVDVRMLQRAWIAAFAAVLLVMMGGPVSAADLENTLYLDVPAGRVVIELRPDLAPKTVARIKELARKGILRRHRLPSRHRRLHGADGRSQGRRHRRLGPEAQGRIHRRRHHVRGTVVMARAQDPDSADSQFFICFAPAPFLDGKYTIFGQVDFGHGIHRRASRRAIPTATAR